MTDTPLDLLEVGVVRLDAELRVEYVNSAAARWLGIDRASPGRRSLIELFLDHRVEQAARRATLDGSASAEASLRGDGERIVAIRIDRAAADGLWLLMTDVTELRRLQRVRSEFVDNVSHELRTPLTTIRLLTETLLAELERSDVPPRIRERIAKIDVETGHLAQMVTELLDLSRIEGGEARLQLAAVDIGAVVTASIERLRTFADRHSVRLRSELPPDLPRAMADEERIGQVLVNLLHNAIKFSPPESVVTVAAAERDGMIAVEVRDQGVGIPRADLRRIFQRFYKVDRARQRGAAGSAGQIGGSGLGLAIARHIVEGHGGRIWADSEEGSGSTFTFTLPLAG